MIKVTDLVKKFGDLKALDNASLHVRKGSIYGLVGPNGAGKTTIIKHLAGVYRQDSGHVIIDGEEIYENPRVKQKIFYIPDELFFFSQYSIIDMAKFYSEFYPAWNQKRFETLANVFKINVRKRVVKLSRGMQKQVAFWMAVSAMPEVMILDEPVDGLDPVMRKKVWSLVVQDVAERGTSVLVSSHNLRELEDVCDSVGIMHQGRVVAERELDSLKNDIHKIQVVFEHKLPETVVKSISILNIQQNGSIYHIIAKGDRDKITSAIKAENPLLFDLLPLTLEEVFIYELGGLGYDVQSVII